MWYIYSRPNKPPSTNSNTLARTVTRTPKHSRITPALKSLHWLKIEQRIQFKIVSSTHNLLHKSKPSYLRKLIYVKPTGKTRSSDHLCLSLFRHSHPSSNSPIALSETLLRVFGTPFPPISGLSLNKFLHHPLQYLFHSTHCLFHAVSSSPVSKHTPSLFHTP